MRKKIERIYTLNDDDWSKKSIIQENNSKKSAITDRHLIFQHPIKLIKELDKKYSEIVQQKQIKANVWTNVQIFSYMDQFFCFNVYEVSFPIYIHLRKVLGNGVLLIGYNRQYPGIELSNKKQLYDHKYEFQQDQQIILETPRKKNVRTMNITISAKKKILNLCFKIDYNRKELVNSFNRTTNLSLDKKFILPSFSKNSLISSMQKKNMSFYFQKTQAVNLFSPIKEKKILLNKNEISKSLKEINKLKEERAKANAEQIEESKRKSREFRELASKCKKIINNFQQVYVLEQQKRKKINKFLTPCILGCIFSLRAKQKHQRKVFLLERGFTTNFLARRFVNKLKKSWIKSHSSIVEKKVRYKTDVSKFTLMEGKLLHEKSIHKSAKRVFTFFKSQIVTLTLSQLFNSSSDYIEKVKKIQLWWSAKYKARIKMLNNYVKEETKKMVKLHPHLAEFEEKFHEKNIKKDIIKEYMIEECMKMRKFHEDYNKKMHEIGQYKQQIKRIQDIKIEKKVSKTKINQKKKFQLKVPNQPLRPRYQFFKNLDILLSMLREWFELQYKKALKKKKY